MAENLNIFKIITISDAKDLMKDDNLTLLDIRDKESFANSHIPNAINLNNDNIEEVLKNINYEENILVYCYKGISSQNVAQHFCNLGYKNIFSLEGGFTEYLENSE
tara:strand:+ start:398 stop:715 length:318 start_codon:yes stop_codon:yes gene_type:complete